MNAPFQIHIPESIIPVHSLDILGVIVDPAKKGQQEIDAFENWASYNQNVDRPDDMIVLNYMQLLEGKEQALARSSSIVNALMSPLQKAGVKITYTADIFYPDAIEAMKEMVANHHEIYFHATKDVPGLLALLPEEVRSGVTEYHKATPADTIAFTEAQAKLSRRGLRIFSHTDADLDAIIAASKADHFKNNQALLTLIDRKGLIGEGRAFAGGAHVYVKDLTVIPYKDLFK